MSATDRTEPSAPTASDLAGRCREAGLVRLLGTADGDALAAVGVLARSLRAVDVPFQASVAPVPDPGETDADLTVTVGTDGGDVIIAERTASGPAYAVARELVGDVRGDEAASTLALAGMVASGAVPGETGYGLLDADLDRRPGLGTPVADLADGLAHSTLVHLPTSGDVDATREALPDSALDGESPGRKAASFVALTAVRGTPARAAGAVERALHPYVDGPFETLAGYADVLDAVARERPGTGVALALGHDTIEASLAAWRDHATRTHRALQEGDIGRYDGAFVVRVDDERDGVPRAAGPLGTVARLALNYRSPEPAVLAFAGESPTEAAAAGEGVSDAFRRALAALNADASVVGRGGRAYAQFDATDATDLVTAFRGAL
jgi:hypothetical protein